MGLFPEGLGDFKRKVFKELKMKPKKHVVIGAGNLGQDLVGYGLTQTEDDFKLFTASKGFKYPCSIDPILDELPDHVWVTLGAGSVEGAQKNFKAYSDLHIRLIMELAQASTSYVLHVFSSDYVVDPLRSLYAYSKSVMENLLQILNRPRTNIYRVGSLYGEHKPALNFPNKLLKNFPKPCSLVLPENHVTPTPTDWLAEKLLNQVFQPLDKPRISNVLPEGSIEVHEWAKLILGPEYEIFTKGYDESRPSNVSLEYNLDTTGLPGPTNNWKDLWDARNKKTKELNNGPRRQDERTKEINQTV